MFLMYVADLQRLCASFCGKLISSAASVDQLPSTLAIIALSMLKLFCASVGQIYT